MKLQTRKKFRRKRRFYRSSRFHSPALKRQSLIIARGCIFFTFNVHKRGRSLNEKCAHLDGEGLGLPRLKPN